MATGDLAGNRLCVVSGGQRQRFGSLFEAEKAEGRNVRDDGAHGRFEKHRAKRMRSCGARTDANSGDPAAAASRSAFAIA